jgi:hypothetical protein
MVLLYEPGPDPFTQNEWLRVGVVPVAQQRPLAVTGKLPAAVTFPPDRAVDSYVY